MTRKPKDTGSQPAADQTSPADENLVDDSKMKVAEQIMREDEHVLRVLAEVMHRRRKALRELAK